MSRAGAVIRELRVAWRRLRGAPVSAFLTVLILALVIGANTAIFSVVEAVLLRPLPYGEPDRLVVVWEDHSRRGGRARMTVAPATFDDYRRQSPAFSGLAAKLSHPFNLVGGGDPEAIFGSEVTETFFPLLAVRPALGRPFAAGDFAPQAEPTLVLSHELWRRRFAAAPDVVGSVVKLDDRSYTVIGVMPAGFSLPLRFQSPAQNAELWVPLHRRPQNENHQAHSFEVIGRLAPGATLAAARGELEVVAQRLAVEFPRECGGVGVRLVPLDEQVVGAVRTSLLAVFAAVTFLLLIACVNLASLLLARGLASEKEMAIRAALGASSGDLLRRLLADGVLLSLLGGAGGALLALAAVRYFPALLPVDLPRLAGLRVDARVLAYTSAVALLAGLAAGLAPALSLLRTPLGPGLAGSGRTGTADHRQGRLGRALVVAQISLSLVLLLGAGLMLESFARLRRVDPGFRPDHVLAFELGLVPRQYPSAVQQAAFFRDVLHRLSALPGVKAAGGISRLPLQPAWGVGELYVEGKATPATGPPEVDFRIVTAGYFDAMGIPLLGGRLLADRDDPGQPRVVLINQALAHQYLAGEPVIGRRIRSGVDDPWMEVVGVVGDVAHDSLAAAAVPEMYVPLAQVPTSALQLILRTGADPRGLAAAVRREVWAVDRALPVTRLRLLSRDLDDAVAHPRFSLALVTGFAGLALALAAGGVFGLMAYSVARRTREIGIRMALGARAADTVRLVLSDVARLTGLGIVLGLCGGFGLARWLEHLLFHVRWSEPLPFLAAAGVLAAAGLLAALPPILRVARLDPVAALRHEA